MNVDTLYFLGELLLSNNLPTNTNKNMQNLSEFGSSDVLLFLGGTWSPTAICWHICAMTLFLKI